MKLSRAERRKKREEQLEGYKSYLRIELAALVDITKWLETGTPYDKAIKLLAEREVYKEMKEKEVRKSGPCQETETLLNKEVTSGTGH